MHGSFSYHAIFRCMGTHCLVNEQPEAENLREKKKGVFVAVWASKYEMCRNILRANAPCTKHTYIRPSWHRRRSGGRGHRGTVPPWFCHFNIIPIGVAWKWKWKEWDQKSAVLPPLIEDVPPLQPHGYKMRERKKERERKREREGERVGERGGEGGRWGRERENPQRITSEVYCWYSYFRYPANVPIVAFSQHRCLSDVPFVAFPQRDRSHIWK